MVSCAQFFIDVYVLLWNYSIQVFGIAAIDGLIVQGEHLLCFKGHFNVITYAILKCLEYFLAKMLQLCKLCGSGAELTMFQAFEIPPELEHQVVRALVLDGGRRTSGTVLGEYLAHQEAQDELNIFYEG